MPEEKPAEAQEKSAVAAGKSAGKSTLVMRIVLIAILIVVLIAAILQANLRRQANRAVALYEEAKTMLARGQSDERNAKLREANQLLESVVEKPLSIIRIRGQASKNLALIKMHLAMDIVANEVTLEKCTQALELLHRASELDPESRQIPGRLRDVSRTMAGLKVNLAVDRATSDATVAGYTAAIALLREAHEMNPKSEQITARLAEYEGVLKQMQGGAPPPAEPQE